MVGLGAEASAEVDAVAAAAEAGRFGTSNPSQPHGSIFYKTSNGALGFGAVVAHAAAADEAVVVLEPVRCNVCGVAVYSGLTKPNPKQFLFFNLTGQEEPGRLLGGPSRVPTTLERAGNFSQSTQVVNGVTIPVSIYDPATGLPVNGDNLANVNDADLVAGAVRCCSTYPAPNIAANAQGYNYETISNAGNNAVALNARYVRTLGGSAGSPFAMLGGGGEATRRSVVTAGDATAEHQHWVQLLAPGE